MHEILILRPTLRVETASRTMALLTISSRVVHTLSDVILKCDAVYGCYYTDDDIVTLRTIL